MKKVLVAVDESKASKNVLSVLRNLVRPPEEVVLLHVQRLEGRSIMIDMLGPAEMSTLKESLQDTEHKKTLDEMAAKILNFYKKEIESSGLVSVRTISREGIPADEILKVAEEEGVDLIIMGSSEKSGIHRLISGCVSKEVESQSDVPVLVAKAGAGKEAYGFKEASAKA